MENEAVDNDMVAEDNQKQGICDIAYEQEGGDEEESILDDNKNENKEINPDSSNIGANNLLFEAINNNLTENTFDKDLINIKPVTLTTYINQFGDGNKVVLKNTLSYASMFNMKDDKYFQLLTAQSSKKLVLKEKKENKLFDFNEKNKANFRNKIRPLKTRSLTKRNLKSLKQRRSRRKRIIYLSCILNF